jgi:nicotinate-nucleotide adenylyltransferase
MVSPQNPLKSSDGMAPFDARMESAQRLAEDNNRIIVTDIETRLHTRYTTDTLRELRTFFPRSRFIWLMGADNLQQIPEWEKWTSIFQMVPIAIFDRATYSYKALASKAARRFHQYRVPARNAAMIFDRRPPAWVYFHTPQHPASSTELRAHKEEEAARRRDETDRTEGKPSES